MWLHVWKKSISGQGFVDDYLHIRDSNLYDVDGYDIAENWAHSERTVGANSGYTFGYEVVNEPPKDVLLKLIRKLETKIKDYQQQLGHLRSVKNNDRNV